VKKVGRIKLPVRVTPVSCPTQAEHVASDHAMLRNMSTQAELSEAVRSILRALAKLSAARAALDQDPEQATAPRDHYARKAVAAFRQFEAAAKSIKNPLTISIRLSPSANALLTDSKA
jgi:hypothetical protein